MAETPRFTLVGTTPEGFVEYIDAGGLRVTCKPGEDPDAVLAGAETFAAESQAGQILLAVKNEAKRRIVAVYSDWRQRNFSIRAALLAVTAASRALTVDEQAELAEIIAAEAWIKSVRDASNLIEADPPEKIASDPRWPVL